MNAGSLLSADELGIIEWSVVSASELPISRLAPYVKGAGGIVTLQYTIAGLDPTIALVAYTVIEYNGWHFIRVQRLAAHHIECREWGGLERAAPPNLPCRRFVLCSLFCIWPRACERTV